MLQVNNLTGFGAGGGDWDIGASTYSGKSMVTPDWTYSCAFAGGGAHLFLNTQETDYTTRFNHYTLSTAWDISTVSSLVNSNNIGGSFVNSGIWVSENGINLYYTSSSYVNWHIMSVAYDASTLASEDGSPFFGSPRTIRLSDDGLLAYVTDIDDPGFQAQKHSLATPWDIGAVSEELIDTYDITVGTSAGRSLAFSTSGKRMFLSSYADDKMYQLDLGTAWLPSTAVYNGVFFDYSSITTSSVRDIKFSHDGRYFYLSVVGHIYQVNTNM